MLPTLRERLLDRPDGGMAIDRHLPAYDENIRRHAVVDAPVEETYVAVLSADFTRTGPLVRALNELRTLPSRLSAALGGGEQPRTTDPLRLRDLPTRGVWVRLEDVPGEEIVFGAIGAVWQPNIDWVETEAGAFQQFDRPGYAKIAASISVRPYGPDRSLVTYEARTATTDETARRRFLQYWRVIGPFAGFLMGRALDRIEADAEAMARGPDVR